MNKTLIWMTKSQQLKPTRKNLTMLLEKEDLFDPSTVDITSEEYLLAESNFKKAVKYGYSIVTFADEIYPLQLRALSLPPSVLYVRGNVSVLNNVLYTGIVGSRESDAYGIQVASSIASEVGYVGVGTISGGAVGIDAASHAGALRAQAPTIAVLGCGLDVNYPKPNKKLFERIEKMGGAIISEFSFGTPPLAKNFPHRNRIIAAMSDAIVLVRASSNSGGMITVNRAMDMNKQIFAVPGNIDNPLSEGTNELIRDGATPLLSPATLIDELILKNPDYFVREKEKLPYIKCVPRVEDETKKKKTPSKSVLNEYESEVVSLIQKGINTQAAIEENLSFDASRLTALLGMMEIKEIIKRKADKSYVIIGGEC